MGVSRIATPFLYYFILLNIDASALSVIINLVQYEQRIEPLSLRLLAM